MAYGCRMSTRLNHHDWIDEGLRTLLRSGVEAVRVEPLALALNVTKGSFYWHFKDRPALLMAMLEAWQVRATNAVIDEVEETGGDAIQRLTTLFTIVSRADGRLERAVRNWAAHDDMAKAALGAVDHRRFSYLETLFRALGFEEDDALARARLCHQSVIGQFALEPDQSAEDRIRERLDIILPMLVQKIGEP